MKRLWICLLAVLAACALAFGALAEADVEQADDMILSEAVDACVGEEPEFTLGEGDSPEAYGIAGAPDFGYALDEFDLPVGYDPADEAVQAAVMSSEASDFTIVGDVLTKYSGKEADVTIPDTVAVIGTSAFSGCKTLKTVAMPNTVTHIFDSAFNN